MQLKDSSLLHQQSHVSGQWVEARSGARFDIIDPGTSKPWASAPTNSAEDAGPAVTAAHEAFQTFSKSNPRDRAKWLLEWHRLIDLNKDDLAQVITHETGKPLAESYGEIAYAQGFTFFFAGEAERINGTVGRAAAPNRRIFTLKQPIGVAVALVPWNFPVAMILRKCGAALAAGCTMVIKPSPETPLSVLVLAELALRAGFAPGVLNVLTTDLDNTPALSEALCRHPLTKKVTFTGSTRVGKLIASICADDLKKCTLELGGNCPFIVFDDADLHQAVDALMLLKWRHAGQACISANRVLVQAGVFAQFEDLLAAKTKQLQLGHGAAPGTTLGPVTTERAIAKVEEQIADAQSKGGRVVLGGQKPRNLDGYFFEPTIISDMQSRMRTTEEEVFGPLCALYRFETEDEAVRLANDTSMGLASYFCECCPLSFFSLSRQRVVCSAGANGM